jgi:hypothetical protein
MGWSGRVPAPPSIEVKKGVHADASRTLFLHLLFRDGYLISRLHPATRDKVVFVSPGNGYVVITVTGGAVVSTLWLRSADKVYRIVFVVPISQLPMPTKFL